MSDTFMRIMPDDSLPSGDKNLDSVPKEMFTTDDQTELDQLYFATDDEKILTGVWECAPCKNEYDSYPVHEMMTIISGSVTLTNNKGGSETFTAGDVFFIPKGAQCTWHITEKLRKFYMIAS